MLYEVFALGGALFYLLLFVVSLVVIFNFSKEEEGVLWGTFWFGIFILACFLFGNASLGDTLSWIKAQGWWWLAYLSGYLFLCGSWSLVFRWWRKNVKRLEAFNLVRDNWLERNDLDAGKVPADRRGEFTKYLMERGNEWKNKKGDKIQIEYLAKEHKAELALRCVLAPLDAVAYFFGEFFIELWTWFIGKISVWMNVFAFNTVKSGYDELQYDDEDDSNL